MKPPCYFAPSILLNSGKKIASTWERDNRLVPMTTIGAKSEQDGSMLRKKKDAGF